MRRFPITRGHLVLIPAAAVLLAFGASLAQGPQPLDEADVLKLVELQVEDQAILARLRKTGVNFPVDAAVLARLKNAGASEAVLAALRAARKRPEALVTYQDVLKALACKMEEAEILKLLEKSPTVFTLDARQVEELQAGGASAKVLAALEKPRPGATPAGKLTDLAILLDCSASMAAKTREGATKMEAAKEKVRELVDQLPTGLRVTFVLYGHDRELMCRAVKVVRPLADLDAAGKAELARVIRGLEPAGHTPIALALKTAGQELAKQADAACGVVLITDGMETCHGSPTDEIAALAGKLNLSFGVHIIGFDVKPEERAAVEAIARAGKGTYYPARSAAELGKAVQAIQETVAERLPPETRVSGRKLRLVHLRVLPPRIKFPALDEVFVVKAGHTGPFFQSADVLAGTKQYGQELRLPGGEKFNVFWRPKGGKRVLLVKDLAITERVRELQPEEHLGVIRVTGTDLPKARSILVTKPGDGDTRFLTAFQVIQEGTQYGQDLVVPAGSYDVCVSPADGGKRIVVEKNLRVEPGTVQVID